MPSYLANHQKTRRVFRKREKQLEHAIRHDFSRDRIVKAAERLREARLKVFKSDFAKSSVRQATTWQPNEEAKRWQAMPVDEIIERYRKKAELDKTIDSDEGHV